MSTYRGIESEHKVELVLSNLCAVPFEYIKSTWLYPESTLMYAIRNIGNVSDDPLVQFYSKTDKSQRLRNAAHLHLAFNNRDVPAKSLVDENKHYSIYLCVMRTIFEPKMRDTLGRSPHKKVLSLNNGFEELLVDVLEKRNPYQYISETLFLDRLQDEYYNKEMFSLDNVYEDFLARLTNKIKASYKGMNITPRKAKIVIDTIRTLTKTEQEVITLRYGLSGERKPYKEVALLYGKTRNRIHQIEESALEKLRNPAIVRRLKILTQPIADSEVDAYLSWLEERDKQEQAIAKRYLEVSRAMPVKEDVPPYLMRSVGELGLSIRAYNGLRIARIKTLFDLTQKTEKDLLKFRNLGRKSLDEIKNALKHYGLSLS